MEIFSDLFKEKIKWTENELSALLSILTYQAKIDGNIDNDSKTLLGSRYELDSPITD